MLTTTISTYSDKCTFNQPATRYEIIKCETALEIEFPKLLTDLLLETNGIHGEYGLRLLWTIEEILETNKEFRNNVDFKSLYMPFDNLLFFADAGTGDQFAFPIQDGEIRRKDVFVWDHEDDSREWIAPDLLKYFEWWLKGQLKF